ncbi:MAG: hypothetical protein HY318_07395, partial [Armatimonadetes bacterium]|nr:hypothetical protein [Armatimonadota bacterium]
LCGVTFLCAWATTHVGLWLRHAEPLLGLEQVVLAWVYLAVAVYLTKRTPPHAEWSKPLDLSALVLSGLGATISAAGGSNNTLWACGVASALTTGLFCLQAWRSDEPVIGYVPAFLVALFYAAGRDVYSENLWALAPALSATGIYFALGYVTHKQRFVFLSLIGLWWAWLMTAGLWLGGELASGIGTQRHLTLVAIVASVAAFGYACVAERWKSTALAYATAVTFILASVAALVAFGVEDSVTLCTLAGVLLTLLLTIEGHRFETLRAPFRHVATLISPGVMLCAYQGTHELFAGVVCGYAVLYFVAAWILRSTSYAYASPATASILLVIHGALHGLSGPQSAFYFALLGLLWVIVGSVLEEMGAWDVLFHSLYQFACGTAALTAIGGFAIALDDVGHGAFAVYALIVDAVVFSALWYRWREEALLHVSYFCVVLAYFLPLIQHQVRVPDAYALPIGLYLIVVGYTGYRKGRLADPNGLYNAGLLISLSSTFLAAMPATAIAHHLVLMTLTVAAVAVGISQRLKTFLVQGTGFLSAFIFYRVSGLLPDVRLNWAFYAIGLAVTLAIALLTFNAKREQVLRSMRWVQKEWTIFR